MCIVILVLLASVVCGLPYMFPQETIVTEQYECNKIQFTLV